MSSLVEQMLKTTMGPIEKLFSDPNIIEIMLNPNGQLWIEKLGKEMEYSGINVKSEKALQIMNLIASYSNTVINENHPSLSAELPFYKARFEGMIPPVTEAPSFTIRISTIQKITLDEYVQAKFITENQKKYIEKAIYDLKNILIIGGTGTGKTTMMNCLLDEMVKTPKNRVLVVEDTRELKCDWPNMVFMRTQDNFSHQQALESMMRCRPDRIVFGEVRTKAALDLLKAWLTGHPGGVASIHSNNAYAGLTRLENLIMEGGAINQQNLIAETVNLLIYIEKTPKGRKVKEIAEVKGFENGKYHLEYIK